MTLHWQVPTLHPQSPKAYFAPICVKGFSTFICKTQENLILKANFKDKNY